MKKNKIVFIFGPTAVGKSNLLFNFPTGRAEVINVDSIQVYKEFNIGSAKPSKELLLHIKHHLIDFLDPNENFNIGIFFNKSKKIVNNLINVGKIPIFVGGNAFYFKHLYEGLPETPQASSEVRNFVDNIFRSKGKDFLLNELKRVDIERYNLIHKNDLYRIKRSLEVYYQTGIPISNFSKVGSGFEDVVLIGLMRKKEEMKERIYSRVKEMMEMGLLEEIKYLLKKGYGEHTPAFKGIGYFEFLLWNSRPNYEFDDIINKISKNSYLYAKRQITFFNKISNVLWFHPENDLDEILSLIF